MNYKPPVVCDPGDDGSWTMKPDHYHTWACGCQSRVKDGVWEVIYCREDCERYLVFKELE